MTVYVWGYPDYQEVKKEDIVYSPSFCSGCGEYERV